MKTKWIQLLCFTLWVVSYSHAQKVWQSPPGFGRAGAETEINPGIDLVDILPAGMTANIAAWDWVTDDKVVFTNWIWDFTVVPKGEIWMLEGMKSQEKSKITLKRYFAGNLREPLGVKVVDGDVYVAVKFALLKMVDANKDGIAEDTLKIVDLPHKPEPSGGWNHYSMDLKYRDGFFYIALPSETVAYGYPGYPVMEHRGSVVKIDRVKKTMEFLVSGLRTPDGLGWGPDSSLFVTDNQGAWLPASKLIHVTKNRFFGLQSVEAGDPNLVESPAAILMPHLEASSSPTQPMLLEKGPYAGQFLIGDNVLGFVNRVSLDYVKGEYQGALYHFTGGLTCGVHRLLQNAKGDVYFGGLGSPTNFWNVKGKYFGMQVFRFNTKPNLEVKEIISKADGFTLRFTSPVGVSAEDTSNYRLQQWNYLPTKNYGGDKLNLMPLSIQEIKVDASRTYVHLKIKGIAEKKVVNFQFHKDIKSVMGTPLWTGEAWYTLNQISNETVSFPVQLANKNQMEQSRFLKLMPRSEVYTLELPEGNFSDLRFYSREGRLIKRYPITTLNTESPANRTLKLNRETLRPGFYLIVLKGTNRSDMAQSVVLP